VAAASGFRKRRAAGADFAPAWMIHRHFACRVALDGIRNQFPDVDDQRFRQILAERVELGRRLESTG
jgi:hypothetical protein